MVAPPEQSRAAALHDSRESEGPGADEPCPIHHRAHPVCLWTSPEKLQPGVGPDPSKISARARFGGSPSSLVATDAGHKCRAPLEPRLA